MANIKLSNFFTRLTNWEYWPLYITNIPLFFFWMWFAIRARHPFFFSAVNPVIETGGLFGESKYNILKRLPESHRPVTLFIKKNTPVLSILSEMKRAGLFFPIIAKPDVGERGLLVSKISTQKELEKYTRENKIDFLVQQYISLPLELAVMHHRLPGEKKGRITSVCIKKTLKIKGDGKSTVRQLMEKEDRARLQLARFEKYFPDVLGRIPPLGKSLELEPIGNHCRGTLFLNGNGHIDEKLNEVFDRVAFQMKDIYYGRFDMKCTSMESLKKTGRFMVLEYNGVGAEPAHIYDPAYPVYKKYRDIFRHWKIIFHIYKIQKRKGVKSMTAKEVLWRFKKYSKYRSMVNH
ncbi:MAG TPA: hypothetical protein ENJ20_02460 [Bacteroidetes bacterium]|nr:hypothetical protein [Bacteroidota bacterium]